MPTEPDTLAKNLEAVARREIPGVTAIRDLARLSGGASQETWQFDGETPEGPLPLILRRALSTREGAAKVMLESEAAIIQSAREHGVLAPQVRYVADPADGIGRGFIMERIPGETIARRILRDDAYAAARPKLAYQCGEILAKIHAVPIEGLDVLRPIPARQQLDEYFALYDGYDYPHPVFELAFQWLRERVVDTPSLVLVHGDFRNGNLVIGEDGVRSVLDWELAHLGDPMEDLGWLCVNSWRFGVIDKPVGGFGERDDLFAGYTAAGGTVDADRVRFWETFGSLKWGIMCMGMYDVYRAGGDRSVERAAIGRRSSETEIDLLNLIRPNSKTT